ncbi:MAG: hypothetical protein AAF945_07795 [Actinomycetota bacterium]
MARDLATYEREAPEDPRGALRRRVDRSTAQALAAAVSALAVATLVVSTSSSALVRRGTAVTSEIETGTITLEDDDGGRSLVELADMAPGRPVTQCITVQYTGTVLPVSFSLSAEADGDIAEFVEIVIERGDNGAFDACDGFVPEEEVFVGRLDDLVDDEVQLGEFRNENETTSFRYTFDLADEAEAAGRSGTVDFVWEAVPS